MLPVSKDDIAPGTVADRGDMRRPRLSVAAFYLAASRGFHAGQVHDLRAVIFPADVACDLFTVLHPRTVIQPAVGPGPGPVASPDSGGASSREQRSVRSGRKHAGLAFRACATAS